jgi:hypothetical protein
MKTHFFIATTGGPVAIQSIAIEDPDFDSVICVDGTTNSLAISANYHEFIRQPTGIIEKITGNSVYRADISAPIDGGQSWQLAMFLAHIKSHFQPETFGGGKINSGDHIILATGRMKADYSVGIISEINKKITTSEQFITDGLAKGAKVSFLLPADNLAEGDFTPWQEKGVEVWAVGDPASLGHIDGFITEQMNCSSILGTAVFAAGEGSTLPLTEITPQKQYNIAGFFALLALFLGAFYYINPENIFDKSATFPPATDAPITKTATKNLILTTTMVKLGGNCSKDHAKQEQLTFKGQSDHIFEDSPLNRLCRIDITLPESHILLIAIARHTGKIIPLTKRGKNWTLPLPTLRGQDRGYSLHMIDHAAQKSQSLLEKLKKQLGQRVINDQLITVKTINEILTQQGWTVKSYSHNLQVL